MELQSGVYPVLLGSLNQQTLELVPHAGITRSHSDMIRMAYYDAEEDVFYYAYWHGRRNRWMKGEEIMLDEFDVTAEIPQPRFSKGKGWTSTITTFRVKLNVDPNGGTVYSTRKPRRRRNSRKNAQSRG